MHHHQYGPITPARSMSTRERQNHTEQYQDNRGRLRYGQGWTSTTKYGDNERVNVQVIDRTVLVHVRCRLVLAVK